MNRTAIFFVLIAGLTVCGTDAGAVVVLDMVSIGNPGNAADSRYETPGYGSVAQTYNIGRYEVTNAQYAEFLNAVARTDTHLLYHNGMGGSYGGILRSGSAGSYSYATVAGRANVAVNYTSFVDACRFTNWMHNGQLVGLQDLTTTETGAYFLNGVTYPVNMGVTRLAGAAYVLPSEDEWYKAAYYDPTLGAAGGYWDYATQSYTQPTAEAPAGTDLINGSANCGWAVGNVTAVGAYTARPSTSAYGTYDQAGNLYEWTEGISASNPAQRCLRGGSWRNSAFYSRAAYRHFSGAGAHADIGGFRVGSQIPEPSTLLLLAVGSLAALRFCRRRREATPSANRPRQ